jgi:hypothetical protein
MKIKLAKTTTLIAALLAVSLSVTTGASAQGNPPKPTAPKSKTKSTAPANSAVGAVTGATAPASAAVVKRDPFEPLINQHKEGSAAHLPPGKAGLVVATVRVDGTIHAQNGMIAIVSNPEQHVYFIREGDRLYDGDVEKIGLDGVTFRENSKDAFGKSIERVVTKRIYASAGEQQ